MNILLGTSAFCNRDEAAALLLQANISHTTALALENEQALNQAGELFANNAVAAIVLYAPLEWALQQAAEQGMAVEQALATWQQNVSQLIRFYKQYRARVLLANIAEVSLAPQAFADACASRWPALTIASSEPVGTPAKPAPFYQLLAYAIQSQAPALQTLSQQLAALSQPLADQSPEHSLLPVDINQLVNRYQNAVAAQQQLPGLLEQQASNQALLNELKEKVHHQQQLAEQEKQAYSQEKQELQSQHARLQEQLSGLQQAHNQARQKQDEQQQENQLLLEQLFVVQEALESRTLEHEKQRAQHQQQQQAYNQEKQELQNQHARLQEQLNSLQKAHIQDKQKQDEQQQENQLLLEQLFSVQEALESRTLEHEKQRAQHQQQQQAYNQKKQELQNQHARLQEQLNGLQQAYEQGKQKQDELQQENQLLLEQLFSVQEELERRFITSAQQEHQLAVVDTLITSQGTNTEKVSVLKQQFKKRAEQKALKRKLADLYNSPFFDAKWYLEQYPDVANDKKFCKNPALHYLKFGGFEGRNPGPDFDSDTYLSLNPDVKAEGFNPLLHYLRFGQAENRRTS